MRATISSSERREGTSVTLTSNSLARASSRSFHSSVGESVSMVTLGTTSGVGEFSEKTRAMAARAAAEVPKRSLGENRLFHQGVETEASSRVRRSVSWRKVGEASVGELFSRRFQTVSLSSSSSKSCRRLFFMISS